VEFHRRRSPRREGAGRLTTGEAERLGHGLGVELAQPPNRGGGTEWPKDAWTVPAFGSEGGIIDPNANARRYLASGGESDQKIAA
jgi:hypothetical protein